MVVPWATDSVFTLEWIPNPNQVFFCIVQSEWLIALNSDSGGRSSALNSDSGVIGSSLVFQIGDNTKAGGQAGPRAHRQSCQNH